MVAPHGLFKKKSLEKKLNGNYTRTLYAVFNKSWERHSTRQSTIQVRWARYADGHYWRNKNERESRESMLPTCLDDDDDDDV